MPQAVPQPRQRPGTAVSQGHKHELVVSDTATSRTAALFTQGLQTRGPLELDLGDRIGAL
jgi:hypothetical protein